ncbi:2OG-Fe(II) oxygenase [Bdellovibrio sp. HCB337]|uniref:2OG-Fe(II) oxygenase n=1 Tax=Bdellovibrio sp. HCB337 TaxID=3394358 RepID=UPI0039A5420B
MQSLEPLFQSIEQNGWAFADGILPQNLEQELFLECQKSWSEGLFHEAHIGRGQEKTRKAEIRGDSILWLNTEHPNSASHRFLQWAAELRQELNHRYFMGLRSEEFHFARYPEGKGYQKHIDQHRGTSHRKISLVLYLNPTWSSQDGGELCIYSPENESQEVKRILPQGGRLVLFRSDLIPHEVLPCFQTRWSLTGWFRTDG